MSEFLNSNLSPSLRLLPVRATHPVARRWRLMYPEWVFYRYICLLLLCFQSSFGLKSGTVLNRDELRARIVRKVAVAQNMATHQLASTISPFVRGYVNAIHTFISQYLFAQKVPEAQVTLPT